MSETAVATGRVVEVKHPLVRHKLSLLRDRHTSTADFRRLVTIGPPLRLQSKETRVREGPKRVMLRYEFRFWQDGEIAYFGDQSAMFVKSRPLGADSSP